HVSALVLHIHVEAGVRIGPLDFGHHAVQCRRFAGVVLRYERMMRDRREQRDEQRKTAHQHTESGFGHGMPPASDWVKSKAAEIGFAERFDPQTYSGISIFGTRGA